MIVHLFFDPPVDELFDIQLLPGVRCPFLSGPHVDRDGGEALWTVPPGGLGPAAGAPPSPHRALSAARQADPQALRHPRCRLMLRSMGPDAQEYSGRPGG